MSDNRPNDYESTRPRSDSLDVRSDRFGRFYAALCEIETLRVAFTQIAENRFAFGLDGKTLSDIESEGVEKFLHHLNRDLQSRASCPSDFRESLLAFRDLIVRNALQVVLGPLFQTDLPFESESAKAIKWVANSIENGLTTAYAVNLTDCLRGSPHQLFLNRIRERTGDEEITGLLRMILERTPRTKLSRHEPFVELLNSIRCEGIDSMLQQARDLGREGTVSHVKCARFGSELIILRDQDPHYDWLSSAVYSRLCDALSKLESDLGDAEIHTVDLADKKKLAFLGYELHARTDRRGRLQVHYRRVDLSVGAVEPAPTAEPRFYSRKADRNSRSYLKILAGLTASITIVGLLIYFLLSSSDPEFVKVEGAVIVPGKPMAVANCFYSRVWLYPDSSRGNKYPRIAVAELRKDGRYSVFTDGNEGVPPGWYRVAIVAFQETRSPHGNAFQEKINVLNPKYAEPETSGLLLHVTPDAAPDQYDLTLP